MSTWHRFVMLVAIVAVMAGAVAAQGPSRPNPIAPPIPDGPTLDMPKDSPVPALTGDTRQAAWLGESGSVIPAGVNDIPWLQPADGRGSVDRTGHAEVSGDRSSAESACHFDMWCQDGVFACGSTSTQHMFGAYFSGRPGPRISSFDYVLASVRHGWMLTCPEDNWIGRGNYEFLVDLSAASVISGGYGDYFAGPTFMLRYNWVEPGATVVPYQQFGLGIVYTDAFKDRTQEAIGQQWEFYLRYEVGMKYFIAPNLSLDAEIGIQHLSNAGHADRNLGANMIAQFGLTYYFPRGGS